MEDVTLNIHVNEYTNRVLGVIKEMFGLKNKSEALNKFVELYGDEFISQDVKEEVVMEIVESAKTHIRKHGMRKMSISELKALSGVKS
ncbi:DUF2683 family protein [Candidatus Micrarchaeota archaeon]|nr:DUF2683 family protein [Candidatus Micrarchaeota archaeon]